MIANNLFRPLQVAFCNQISFITYKKYAGGMIALTQFKFIAQTIHEIY